MSYQEQFEAWFAKEIYGKVTDLSTHQAAKLGWQACLLTQSEQIAKDAIQHGTGVGLIANGKLHHVKREDFFTQENEIKPVAIVSDGWSLSYYDRDYISDIVSRHNLRIGDKLYLRPQAQQETSAERTLKMLGYTNCGGEFWKPPLGKASQAQQEPVKATNLFEIVTHGESGDAWLLLRADVNFGLGHHCIKFEGAAADDLRKRFKVMGNMQSQAQQTNADSENDWYNFNNLQAITNYLLSVDSFEVTHEDDEDQLGTAKNIIESFKKLQSQAQQPTAYRVIASANGEVVRDSLEFTRMSEIDEKVVRKSYDLEIVPLYAAMQSQQDHIGDSNEMVEKLRDAIASCLTSVYVCTRVWSAWSYGTMSEDDFIEAGETEFLDDLVGVVNGVLQSQAQQEPSADIHEAITLLSAVFDAWENGTDCYDDFDGVSGSFIGKAFKLDDEIFKRCCDLLNRVNPPRNVSQAQQTESQWIIPTESQILAATEKAGLWPNTVYTWIPAFHRYHVELAKLPPSTRGIATMTDNSK